MHASRKRDLVKWSHYLNILGTGVLGERPRDCFSQELSTVKEVLASKFKYEEREGEAGGFVRC